LDESDSDVHIRQFLKLSPPALILVPVDLPDLERKLADAGCLVLSRGDRTPVIAATLMAYADSRVYV
jgi:hypothetical protein